MADVDSQQGGATRRRPDIVASWRRASIAGVRQTGTFERLVPLDIDVSSTLLVRAEPVLEQLETTLVGTGYLTIMADRECRVVRRWFDDPDARVRIDRLGLLEGVSVLEDSVGTNGLGTVFETRQPIVVHGPEHFAEALRRFSCYGHPIRHPLTRRIEGVLNISARTDTASPLLPAIIARAAHDIEQRLLAGSRISEKSLLAAFQEASGQRKRAVLAIGEDIVMTNQAASDMLGPSDIALLRVLAEDSPTASQGVVRLTLASGRSAEVSITRVPSVRLGVLMRVEERPTGRHLLPSMSTSLTLRASAPTLVCGPPGTGRTTRAVALAPPPAMMLRAATALLEGPTTWASDFASTMERSEGSAVLDGIDLLADGLLDLVIEAVEQRSRPQIIMTCGPVASLTGRAATLAATAMAREELTPLSTRRTEIPALAASMLSAVAANESVHFTPGALHALAAHHWPGNLRELKAVVTHAAARRSTGGIALTDLPEEYRVTGPSRTLSALDQAGRDAIVVALREANGNKVQAATRLGVSRTTLYARIRQLRITTY